MREREEIEEAARYTTGVYELVRLAVEVLLDIRDQLEVVADNQRETMKRMAGDYS